MDWQYLFNVALGLVSAVVGWILRTVYTAMRELERDVASLREALPHKYTGKEEFNRFVDALFHKLDRIEEKMDRKVDK